MLFVVEVIFGELLIVDGMLFIGLPTGISHRCPGLLCAGFNPAVDEIDEEYAVEFARVLKFGLIIGAG